MIVLPNLYGDIVSDLGAGLIGGLGPGAGSQHRQRRARSSRPRTARRPSTRARTRSTPRRCMLSGVLMLHHLDEAEAADRMEAAIAEVISKGDKVTYDLKPSARRSIARSARASLPTLSSRKWRSQMSNHSHRHGRRRRRSATACCSGSPAARCSARRAGRAAAARDPRRRGGGRGRGDGARRLRLPAAGLDGDLRRRRNRPSTGSTWRCWWARGRAARAWSAPTCCRRTAASSPTGRGAQRRRGRRRARARGGQPRQHQLPDRDEQRARHPRRALHRHDPPGPQPRGGAAGRKGRRASCRTTRRTWACGATTHPRCTPTCSTRR